MASSLPTSPTRPGPVSPSASAVSALRPLPHSAVRLTGGFLGEWQDTNRSGTIPHAIQQLEESQALNNVRRITGEHTGEFVGLQFADSDIYKTLEAIGWEAGRSDIAEFLPFVDSTIDLLARAQESDGYLDSFYQLDKPEAKLVDLRWGHEMYCLGHLLQAGIAWKRTTDREDLLEIGLRFADLIVARFGPDGAEGVCGHPEIETALIETYRTVGDEKYLRLAERFVDLRGKHLVGEDRFGYAYFQDHEPVREVDAATGHAVRQLYLAAGVTDLYAETGDRTLWEALERIWTSVHEQKMYISGGLGSRHRDESFGDPYELPPDRAYSETCAAIANFQWNWRMLLASGQSRFADEMERGLYNAIAVSTTVDGCAFFYSNPLQLRSDHDGSDEDSPSRRLSWYTCACCPPNLARLVSSLDDYVATTAGSDLQVHLYADATIALDSVGGDATSATVDTAYPWDGAVGITFDRPFTGGRVLLRMPTWAEDATVVVNGEAYTATSEDGYLVVDAGAEGVSSIALTLPVRATVRQPHPYVDASRGCIALTRGPVVYAVEQADLPEGVTPEQVLVPATPVLTEAGVDAVTGPRLRVAGAQARTAESRTLYATPDAASARPAEIELVAIPYYRWGNRSDGGMRVWLPTV